MEVPSPESLVEQLTNKKAHAFAISETSNFRKQLLRQLSKGLIDASTFDALDRGAMEDAKNQYVAERNAGKHNDMSSREKGLVAIIREHGQQKIDEWIAGKGATLFAPDLTEIDVVDGLAVLKMKLPEGAFEAVSTGIKFYPEVRVTDGHIFTRDKDDQDVEFFGMYMHDVIRIEGSGGELWQNPEYFPDGTRRIVQSETVPDIE